MSFEAINQTTTALQRFLQSQLTLALGNAAVTVTLLPPGDTLPNALGVNLYLYHVVQSPYTRNEPWRGDRSTPPSDRPALGLSLYYLLTPRGADPQALSGDDAHLALGAAMLACHENPILNNVHLPDFDADRDLPQALQDSYEQVKIRLASTSLEELSKIWATINQPYRLSVAYEVSLIELTPVSPLTRRSGIVLETDIAVVTLDRPRVAPLDLPNKALAQIDGNNDVTANTLQLNGFGLVFSGEGLPGKTRMLPGKPTVTIGGTEVKVAELTGQPTLTTPVIVDLPIDVKAGPQADILVTLLGRTSLPVSLMISPWLARITPLRAAPDPAQPQDLTLRGSGLAGAQKVRLDTYTATVPVTEPVEIHVTRSGGTDTEIGVQIPGGLANGLYKVRVVVNNQSVSNSRTLEIVPLLGDLIDVTVVGNAHRLIMNGMRLAGKDVRLLIDEVEYQTGRNTEDNKISYLLSRLLNAGTHTLSIKVDASLSASHTFVVSGGMS